jgi:hypothetical protein
MAEYEGAAPWQRVTMDGGAGLRLQGKHSIITGYQFAVHAGETIVKAGRHPFEGTHGRRRIEKINADQMYLMGPESIGATEYFSDIEGRFEAVQHNYEAVGPRCGQQVGILLPAETLSGGNALLLEFAAKLSQSHIATRFDGLLALGGGYYSLLLAEILANGQPTMQVGEDKQRGDRFQGKRYRFYSRPAEA